MKKRWIYSLSLLAIAVLANFACRKPNIEKAGDKKLSQVVTGQVPVTISIEEIYAQLPQTIMHNLADKININVSLAEWRYEAEYLMVRIPLNQAGNKSYLYAVKPYNNPLGRPHVFLSQLLPEAGSTSADFSGKQMWLNLQDWKVYGVQYGHNTAMKFMDPISINPAWESTMLDAGLFYLGSDNKIAVYDDPSNPDVSQTGMRPTGDRSHGDDLMGNGKGRGFFGWLFGGIGDVISGIGNWLGGLGGLGGGSGGTGSGDSGGGGWDGYDPGGPGYGGGGSPNSPGGGGGGGYTPPPPPEEQPPISIWDSNMAEQLWASIDEPGSNTVPVWVNGGILNNNTSIYAIENPTITYLVNTLGLNQAQSNWLGSHLNMANNIKQFLIIYVPGFTMDQKMGMANDHLKMMMENPDYLNQINNLTGNWWDVDQNGFVTARKMQMELYLQANPYGMIDCNNLNVLPMNMYQEVGNYQVPQSVLTRINTLRDLNAPAYTASNFKVKPIQEGGGGVVNCDYFYIKINSLPYMNNVQMTADQLLEYFRTHFNSFISPSVGVSFQPYIDYVAGSVNINETAKFNSSYENSLGALVHIDMLQDGTVVESGYSRNNITNHHSFTFTTMYTPLDGDHPVAGNRRWGIFQSGGAYYFYILGVDRTNDFGTTIANLNLFGNQAFSGADDLWHDVQIHILDFCDTHQGDAVSAQEMIARPNWSDATKQFLLGQITLQQMKAILHCP